MDKEIEKNLASCLEEIGRGESLEQCLARYPHLARELEPLLRTAMLVQKSTRIEARPGFKASTRSHLLSSLKPSHPPVLRQRFISLHWRWTAALASLLVVLLSGGTIAMANNSLPDQTLYPVKIATEEVQLALAPNDMYKARKEIDFAERRTNEIAELARRNHSEGIERANQRLARNLDRFAAIIGSQENNNTEARAEMEALLELKAARHQAVLERTIGRVPEPAKPALRNAIERSKASYQEARQKIWEEKLQKQKKLQEQKKKLQEQKQGLPRKNQSNKTSGQKSLTANQPTEEPSEY